ncbi:double-strand break repair helicase AddA [Qipengyuania qiaonensis]|uniref:DNA 3'-5' helicase n=1 Tax=Qipengyuania qiaonensis TaxID=2867240 RepID=A0ABS7JC76_9SPHN|nr:double-strand break repair helicase AddA [Qipengyuania qiaonensis]MBX7483570.1 double-strand break repair helicase AddA [Qipengyuania qiaonensis]
MSGKVYPLVGHQRDAVDPHESVWLSASAGTGKTQVLSARVLRLLLEPSADPSQILCLTFTKAGAAEMAVRVNEVLARWVRLSDTALAEELGNLGAATDPDARARARSLFARVLDCPGGGLRIDTIHAFAQYLLAAFPNEAQILPGSQPMEDRDRELLSLDVLAELLETGDPAFREAVAEMSRRKGADAVREWLMKCTGYLDLWRQPGWQGDLAVPVCRALGIPSGADREWVEEACADIHFPIAALQACGRVNAEWNTATGLKNADFAADWLAASPAKRLETLDGFFGSLLTQKGEPSRLANLEKIDPSYGLHIAEVVEGIAAIAERRALLDLADFLVPQLVAGRAFALRWEEAKAREGLVDFDDLIIRAAHLLSGNLMADWIRYKLDRSFDHILVDEAQDTNRAQWEIVEALADDFFSGEGARGDIVRTIFTVGDFKQAIFGFQGTSPRNFSEARDRFAKRMRLTADAAGEVRSGARPRYLQEYGLGQSFRTADTVLDFVDRAIGAIGSEQLGLDRDAEEHDGQARPGMVTLWNLIHADSGIEEGEVDEGWLGRHDRKLADRIALQVRRWMDQGFPLVKDRRKEEPPRRAGPGDVMVLVRKRRDLASLIVARLYRHGVPVAGVDRLRLGNPLAVKDLMAAIRFAAQPLDDLTLACLLVSPLIGWSQEDLLEYGYREKNIRLWEHLRGSEHPYVTETMMTLREILRRADFDAPQQLLHWILIGPMDGRRRLVARLGREANDPIDELLNAASAYAASHVASLQGFIQWFDAGEGEIKREAGESRDQVRVMTVHGSKGLQAPIVILADAAIGPDGARNLELEDKFSGTDEISRIPLPGLNQEQKVGPLRAAEDIAAAAEMEEHWRLLYVAMTRAEEALFIGGSLGPREVKRGVPHEDSWYARLQSLFGGDAQADDLWGSRWEWGELTDEEPVEVPGEDEAAIDLPDWATRPVGPEPRPPRPLSPSGLGEVEGSDPPLPPAQAVEAARRGVLIHALLERLPQIAEHDRADRAQAWLARQASDLSDAARDEIVDRALAVIADPDFAEVFGADALTEVPLAATVDGQVVMGTIDRLLVTPKKITVVDFKTARRPPASVDEIPDGAMKQMAAYVAALEVIYPVRTVEAAVLYTQTPQLFALPSERLASYKSAFAGLQESFALPPVE